MIELSAAEALLRARIPAIALLVGMGYTYLRPGEAACAGGRHGCVLLEAVLRERLRHINRIQCEGRAHPVSEESVSAAVEALAALRPDGLARANAATYRLLTMGLELAQSVQGSEKIFDMRYIDWDEPANNCYHIAAGLNASRALARAEGGPDLVLFVNGIPFALIGCAAPEVGLEGAVDAMMGGQSHAGVPGLYFTVQKLLVVNRDTARHACPGTQPEHWSDWQEEGGMDELRQILEAPLTERLKAALFDLIGAELTPIPENRHRIEQERAAYSAVRQPNPQDRSLYALCRPDRLLGMARGFTVFEGGERKYIRFHQSVAVQRALERVGSHDVEGRRQGGVIWQVKGSGKSQTMALLARALSLAPELDNPRVVLVSERKEWARHLEGTFDLCGVVAKQARSAPELLRLLANSERQIITTQPHRLTKNALAKASKAAEGDIFLLVDESRETALGGFAETMAKAFPQVCYVGFIGTPLDRIEKTATSDRFGELIDAYPARQAVLDGAVLPLLYEARIVRYEQARAALDEWFRRHAQDLTDEQKMDLRHDYARASMLEPEDQLTFARAFEISEHFRANFKGSGLKGQLLAPDVRTALLFHETLRELGHVRSELLISKPELPETGRKGDAEVDPIDGVGCSFGVAAFWREALERYGSAAAYARSVREQYAQTQAVEILVIADPALAGVETPKTAVLYLATNLAGHQLLDALSRVNRPWGTGKRQGVVLDFTGALGSLDRPFNEYPALSTFDEEELHSSLCYAVPPTQDIEHRAEDAKTPGHPGAAKQPTDQTFNPSPGQRTPTQATRTSPSSAGQVRPLTASPLAAPPESQTPEAMQHQTGHRKHAGDQGGADSEPFRALALALLPGRGETDLERAQNSIREAFRKHARRGYWRDRGALGETENTLDDLLYTVEGLGWAEPRSQAQKDEWIEYALRTAWAAGVNRD